MADEEKNTSAEIDDWLDDFEEADKTGAQIDQSEIEALLGGGDAPAASSPPAAAGSAEIDQADLDALLNGSSAEAAPAPAEAPPAEAGGGDILDQSNIDALLGADDAPTTVATEAGAGEIDQSDIDALLGGGDAPAASSPPAGNGSAEIDQADLDALFGGTAETPPATAAAAGGDESPVSQDDIDALFGGGDEATVVAPEVEAAAPPPASAAAPSSGGPVDQAEIDALFGDFGSETEAVAGAPGGAEQNEIDQLFSEFTSDAPAEEKPFKSEEVDFTDMMEEGKGGDEAFTLGDDDFSLNSSDFTLDVGAAVETGGDAAAEDIFGDEEATQALPDFLASDAGTQDTMEISQEEKKFAFPFHIPEAMKGKTAMGAALLVVLLLVGGYLFLKRGGKEPAIVLPPTEQQVAALDVAGEVNTAPKAISTTYQMPKGGGEVPILLTAEDKEDDALTFEVTVPPAHGRLSGELPKVIYLPNKDFPGEDRFTFLASDGKAISDPMDIVISGPNLSGKAATAVAKAVRPKKVPVLAENVDITMRSTDTLDLDWRRIWQEANHAPFGANVGVEIIAQDLHGSLIKNGPARHRYQPDPYFSGRESIKYRFKRGKTVSKTREVRLALEMGAPPPQIRLAPLASAYHVGERVVMDASASRDEDRQSLRFAWEQTGGTPVRIDAMNPEGSIISFVVPSSFYSASQSGPTLRLTAIDSSGQQTSQEVSITTVSRRKTALWRGTASGRVALEPDCPQGRCPGRLLPWPYPN